MPAETAEAHMERDEAGECHTAVDGESCHKAVEWARTHGIRLHPVRYERLHSGSTFQEFQEFLYKNRLEHCLRPCDVCHTAEPGETCHTAVTEAMAREDLEMSTFEEVQALLNRTDANSSCPVPCNLCHTAQPGEACFKGVRWAMQNGIHIHPDRYPGLQPRRSPRCICRRLRTCPRRPRRLTWRSM